MIRACVPRNAMKLCVFPKNAGHSAILTTESGEVSGRNGREKQISFTSRKQGIEMSETKERKTALFNSALLKRMTERGKTAAQIQYLLGLSPKQFSDLLNGEMPLTDEIAEGLAESLDTTTRYWTRFQEERAE